MKRRPQAKNTEKLGRTMFRITEEEPQNQHKQANSIAKLVERREQAFLLDSCELKGFRRVLEIR